MKNILIAVGASLLLQAAAAPAAAQMGSYRSERVKSADLNLNSNEGLARLDSRILAAARNVCSDSWSLGPMSFVRMKKCVKEAVAAANQQRDRIVAAARRAAFLSQRVAPFYKD